MLDPKHPSEQTPTSVERLGAEIAGGILGGLGGGIAGMVVGSVIGGNLSGPQEVLTFAGMYGYEATGWVGIIVGVIIGGSACVYVVGRRGGHRPSYVATLVASLLAVLLGAALLFATGKVAHEDWLLNKHPLTLPTLFLTTVLGGIVGCELTRHTKEPMASDGEPPPSGTDMPSLDGDRHVSKHRHG